MAAGQITIDRRALVSGTAALLAGIWGAGMIDSTALAAAAGLAQVTGKGIGDFDFLAGEWRIHHRQLKDASTGQWHEYDSTATVHRVLDGMGSIEELRKPDGRYLGMGVRVWHPEEAMWADHWTSAANGVVNAPQMGRFIDHAGVFLSEETDNGIKMLYRGAWDQISPKSCRWHQSSSKDGGKTWDWNWYTNWSRIGKAPGIS